MKVAASSFISGNQAPTRPSRHRPQRSRAVKGQEGRERRRLTLNVSENTGKLLRFGST